MERKVWYEVYCLAYEAAISFTDIDTDKTSREFRSWFEDKCEISIPEYWEIGAMNNIEFEQLEKLYGTVNREDEVGV